MTLLLETVTRADFCLTLRGEDRGDIGLHAELHAGRLARPLDDHAFIAVRLFQKPSESSVFMSDRIIFRTGEALVAGGPPFTAAEPEVVIGELDGPVGTALATLTGDQSMGHSKVFAILNTDIQVRPVTLCVSKVTVKNSRYTNILMGTVQAAIANGVLDAVRAGDLPKEQANDLGIICSVWLNPGVITDDDLDHKALFDIHRKAMAQAIHKAMHNEPSIDWLLENQDKITHKYYQMGLDGKI